ncbi:MAG: type II toxin-antitoxin system VapC family toxin [Elusimicrobia bacterium]|nr:type II toxin-antitoxin system VapC family toxin [Elusimicrobiota bacterium]
MTAWVVDGSLALAWALPDERSAQAERFLRALKPGSTLEIPALWWHEVANALIVAEHRGRISASETARVIEAFRSMPLKTHTESGAEAAWRWCAVARERGLSAYDAAYLELAQRLGAGLATLDEHLAGAASAAGVKTYPPRS